MTRILHIDSSANVRSSISKMLAQEFVAAWKSAHPSDTITYRDFGKNPVPPVDQNWLDSAFAPPDAVLTTAQRLALGASNALVDELLAADFYVFSIPMYNFTIPSTFKAYIDQIVRFGRTVAPSPTGLQGLVQGKKMLIISARMGDYSKGGPRESFDFHESYLRAIFGFIGITDITYVPVSQNPQHDDQVTLAQKLEAARAMIQEVAVQWDRLPAAVR